MCENEDLRTEEVVINGVIALIPSDFMGHYVSDVYLVGN